MRSRFVHLVSAAAGLVGVHWGVRAATAETAEITIHVDQPGIAISPKLYGLMTEEINHAYDGGLYAELIQNRAFKDAAKEPKHWSVVNGDGGAATISLD